MTTTKTSETEELEADLELTRRHLAQTVQELSRQLNVPLRVKESASSAGHRAVQVAGTAGARAKQMPATAREHPKAAAAVGGAMALGVGAAAWRVRRGK
ncbi:DUF3618 domain-containing protein [Kribbella catacumbae]|uniref:DUF3618 domain-containing protein n=1 Tax=Kribbella catacumbae TaxID=460086 RepID=UPI00037F150C|nr:DUF3618 domain-containing protein [Kribbella catacumbae]